MPSIAVTGTFGSGKSLVASMMREKLESLGISVTSYSADLHNRSLLEEDPDVRRKLKECFGPDVLNASGIPDRSRLAEIITQNDTARADLEGILHPLLRAKWLPDCESMTGSKKGVFIAELPLLFEKNLEGHFDTSVTVDCSDNVRRRRVAPSRGLDPAMIDRWVSMQLPGPQKAALADHLVWNDGPVESMALQIDLLAGMLVAA
jgi:dephospho-CoA kinase